MTAAATNSSRFPLFSSLPPELRNQTWRNALPEKLGPALYFYRKGCWCPRRLSESDEGYDPENDENNLNFEFRHDLLDDVQFEVALVFVNREARGIALAWVREQGIEIRRRENRQYPVFVRPFNPIRDALYIELNKWMDFLCEPDDRRFQPDLFEQLLVTETDLKRIAVPEALLRSEVATLPEMLRHFFNLKVLLIIVNAQPNLQSGDNDMKVQRRWEFECAQGGAFFWNDDRGCFDFGDCEYIGDETLYRLIEEASKGLGQELAKNDIRSFEIRLVFAVRK
ncbi:MAG: hypothetical protein Q9164_006597 [Protoblastenia rupestris]